MQIIVEDVNDNAPIFISPSTMYIDEEVPLGTLVGTVKAIDIDDGDNARIQYRIMPWSHPDGIFIINPLNGNIRVIFFFLIIIC